MNENIRERMRLEGISQTEMILKLQERGITVQPPEMSQILRGVNTYPKAAKVLSAIERILTDVEHV